VLSADDALSSGLHLPDIIKMDVEGAQTRVLRGAGRLLGLRIWLISIHGAAGQEECVTILKDAGFRLTALDVPSLFLERGVCEICAFPN
jgi:hypothetical protein